MNGARVYAALQRTIAIAWNRASAGVARLLPAPTACVRTQRRVADDSFRAPAGTSRATPLATSRCLAAGQAGGRHASDTRTGDAVEPGKVMRV
jgi:hypothetical protein